MKEAVAGYDDAGNMTVYELEPGEQLPPGVHPKPPPGTHPHEGGPRKREAAHQPQPQPTPPPELFEQPIEPPPPTTQNAIVSRNDGRVVDYPVSRGPKRK